MLFGQLMHPLFATDHVLADMAHHVVLFDIGRVVLEQLLRLQKEPMPVIELS